MIYAHLGYREIPGSEFLQQELDFLKDKKWHVIPKGVDVFKLSSHHPYWKQEAKKMLRNSAYEFQERVNICKKDPRQIKYLFNAGRTIHSLENELRFKFERINKEYNL